MLIFLMTLLATLSSVLRPRAALQLENIALRHQIGVLQRSAVKRPKLTSGDRLFWICLSRLWRDWRSALAIVKPETVIAWHRAGFRVWFRWHAIPYSEIVDCGESWVFGYVKARSFLPPWGKIYFARGYADGSLFGLDKKAISSICKKAGIPDAPTKG
jgi:hypothetical protein